MNTVPGLVIFEDSNFTTIFELADLIIKDKSISFFFTFLAKLIQTNRLPRTKHEVLFKTKIPLLRIIFLKI